MKILSVVILFYSSFLFSQMKIKIIDSETQKPISEVRTVYNDEISYTNDDGFAVIPSDAENIELYAPQYEKGLFPVKNIIELKPIYKEIQEVIIKSVDAKKIIASVLKDYNKNYETKTSIYNGTLKSRSEIDNKLDRILVIDMNLWTLNNKYDYRKKADEFLQVDLKNKKFDKNKKNDKTYIFNKKDGTTEKKYIKSFLQKFFIYDQLYAIDYYTKGVKISGNIINEFGDIQTIKFRSERTNITDLLYFEGVIQYNKKENAIIYLQCNQKQENVTQKYNNYFDQEIIINTDLFSVTYDMYKKDGKYVPAKIIMKNSSSLILNHTTYPSVGYTEFTFTTHNFANKSGLSKRIDLDKPFGEGISDNSIKDTKTLLSAEEQKFVDEP